MLVNEYRLEIQFKKVRKVQNISNIPTVGSRPLECRPVQNGLYTASLMPPYLHCVTFHVKLPCVKDPQFLLFQGQTSIIANTTRFKPWRNNQGIL